MSIAYFFIKNTPEKLLAYLKETKNSDEQEKIVNRLIELKAEKELWNILETKNHQALISEALLEVNHDKPDMLMRLYNIVDEQFRKPIVERLVELKAEKELWNIIKTKTHQAIISEALFKANHDKPDMLMRLYNIVDEQFRKPIVERLVELKAEKELWNILETKNHQGIISEALLKANHDKPDMLMRLYNIVDEQFRDPILQRLSSLGSIKELWEYNPFHVLNSLVKKYSYSEFHENYRFLINYLYSNHAIAKMFFSQANNRIRLFLVLRYFDNSFSCRNDCLLPYYNSIHDCKSEKLDEFVARFPKVWQLAIDNNDPELMIFAYLLNSNEYRKKCKDVSNEMNIVDDVEQAKMEIKKTVCGKKESSQFSIRN